MDKKWETFSNTGNSLNESAKKWEELKEAVSAEDQRRVKEYKK